MSDSWLLVGWWATQPGAAQVGEPPAPLSRGGPPSQPRAFTPPRCSRARDNWSVWCVPLSWLGSPTPSKPLGCSKLSCPALPLPSSEAYCLTAPLLCSGPSSSSFTRPWPPVVKASHYFPHPPCRSHFSVEDTCPGRDSNPGTDEPSAQTPLWRKKDSREQRTDSYQARNEPSVFIQGEQ